MESSLQDFARSVADPVESEAASSPKVSKTAVTIGVGCVAAFVAYALYQSYLPSPPQALFSCCSRSSHEPVHARIVCVNFSAADRTVMESDTPLLLNSGESATVEFQTVTFYDDVSDVTIGGLREATQSATRFAHREINRKNQGSTPAACVTLQTATDIDGEGVELFDTNAQLVQYAHGRVLHRRRCLGFSADGKGVEVVEWESNGIFDGRRASSRWPSRDDLERQRADDVLQHCCVPSQSSFTAPLRTYRVGHMSSHDGRRIYKEDKLPLDAPTHTSGEACGVDTDAFARWWQSSLPILTVFLTAARAARTDHGGMGALLASSCTGTSPWGQLCRVGRTVRSRLGLMRRQGDESSPPAQQFDATGNHLHDGKGSPTDEHSPSQRDERFPAGVHCFGVSFELKAGTNAAQNANVEFWASQTAAIVAKVAHVKLTDTRVSLVAAPGASAGVSEGIAFQIPVAVTLVEALTVALNVAGLLSWSGAAPSRARVAALKEVSSVDALESSQTAAIMKYIPFQTGCCDLIVGQGDERVSLPVSSDKTWCVMADFC